MLRDIVLVLCGMGVSGILVGVILFVKMGRENAELKRQMMRIASGVAHGNAMQQTIHGEELERKHGELDRTRRMAERDVGLTDSDLIDGGHIG
jgi:hypothetical protein